MYSLLQTDVYPSGMFMKPSWVSASCYLKTEYEGVSHLIDTRVKRWKYVLTFGIIEDFQIVDSRKILHLFKYFEKVLSINYLLVKTAIPTFTFTQHLLLQA